MSKGLHNRANIVTKYYIIFLGEEKAFKFILMVAKKHTLAVCPAGEDSILLT
jgi:hypothetical protein